MEIHKGALQQSNMSLKRQLMERAQVDQGRTIMLH
jgi:hypothetical protein